MLESMRIELDRQDDGTWAVLWIVDGKYINLNRTKIYPTFKAAIDDIPNVIGNLALEVN